MPDIDAEALRGLIEEMYFGEDIEPGELRPCPFCGGSPRRLVIEDVPEDHENFGGHVIECTGCHASSPVQFEFAETLDEKWNKRDWTLALLRALEARAG